MNSYELTRVIALFGLFNARFREAFPDAGTDSTWAVISQLVRLHIEGQPVSLTGLIAVSGLPYGTAMRRIHSLVETGMIELKPRTATGKSFHYLPSPALLAAFEQFAGSIKIELARLFVEDQLPDPADCYFGGVHQRLALSERHLKAVRAIPGVARMRFLAQDDWYFMSLRHLWSDLRRPIGPFTMFTLLDPQGLHDELVANAARPVSEFDILALPAAWLREFSERGALAPVPAGERPAATTAAFAAPVRDLVRLDGVTLAAPGYVSVDLLAVRRDLFEEAGIAFPATPADVLAAARRFHHPRRQQIGLVWNGRRGRDLGRTFRFIMACLGTPLLKPEETGADALGRIAGRLAGEPGQAGLDYLRALVGVSGPGVLEGGIHEQLAPFLAGRVAMSFLPSLDATRYEIDIGSMVKGRVAYLPPPRVGRATGLFPLGGFVFAVPANLPEDRHRSAMAFLDWIAAPDPDPGEPGGRVPASSLFSLVRDPESARHSALHQLIAQLMRQRRVAPPAAVGAPGDLALTTLIGEELHGALTGEMPPRAALEAAAARIGRIAVAA